MLLSRHISNMLVKIFLTLVFIVYYVFSTQAMNLPIPGKTRSAWLSPTTDRVSPTPVDSLLRNVLINIFYPCKDCSDTVHALNTLLKRLSANTVPAMGIESYSKGKRERLPSMSSTFQNHSSIAKRSAGYRSRCCYVDVFCYRGCLALTHHKERHRRNLSHLVSFQNNIK